MEGVLGWFDDDLNDDGLYDLALLVVTTSSTIVLVLVLVVGSDTVVILCSAGRPEMIIIIEITLEVHA